ncbi:MAG: hypothetical protein JRH19_01470, partial [Deltaproteobacteria bacterium]|nr:hypothetical protein [Deltaproteobacteria bacterium]
MRRSCVLSSVIGGSLLLALSAAANPPLANPGFEAGLGPDNPTFHTTALAGNKGPSA